MKKTQIRHITRSALLACLSAPATAYAQEEVDYFALSAEQLFSATVVSATKTEESWWTTPAAVYVLTGEDIHRSGATSIPEALRMVPGVQVARYATGGWAVSVRGFNSTLSNKLLVLRDGRELYDPLFSGVYWDIQDTVLEDIERIEVVRGPGGTLWGSNAVAGVINIITKKAKDTQGEYLSLTAGNQERFIVEGRHGGALPLENGYYRTYAKTRYADAQRALTGGEGVDNWRAQHGGFRMDWDKGREHNFTVQGEVYRNETMSYRNLPLIVAPYNEMGTSRTEAQGGHVSGNWTRAFSEDEQLTFKTYLNYSTRDQWSLEDRRLTLDADLQYEFPEWESHKFVIGGQYRLSTDKLTATPIITFDDSERTDNTFSGFVQDRITLVPKEWILTLGSKFEHNDYSGFEVQPSARLQWHPAEDKMVWAAVSRAVRTPSRLEHDLDTFLAVLPPPPLPITFELLSNSDFTSEELTAYEIGYRHELTRSLMLDLTAFYNQYDSLATIYINDLSFTYRPGAASILLGTTNDTGGQAYGGEAVLNWRVRDNWNLSTAYSYLWLGLEGPPSVVAVDVDAPERESPRHQFNIRSQWDMTDDLAFDTIFYYVGSLGGRQQTESYTRLDMRLGWKLNDQLYFNLVGQNLLDDAHREFFAPTDINAVEIRRSIYGNLVWRF